MATPVADLGPTGLGEMHVELPDGRRLQVTVDGDAEGVTVIVHHGTPGAPMFDERAVAAAREHGLRLVGYARPGYGTSTRRAGRRVADCAADVAAIADALATDRFLTMGASGGGPHALACAALLPDRVVAAACLAGIAPYHAEGLDFLGGMGEGNIEEFGLVINGGEQGIRPLAEQQMAEIAMATPESLITAMAPFLTETDAQVLRDGYAATLLAGFREAGRVSADGWVDDDLLFVEDWGFDLATIRVPVLIWQGRQDAMVPFAHGEWLAAHVPDADVRLTEEDSHLSLVVGRLPEVHAWLRARWEAAVQGDAMPRPRGGADS